MWFSFDLYTVQLQNADLKVNQFRDSLINRFFIAKTFLFDASMYQQKTSYKGTVLISQPHL